MERLELPLLAVCFRDDRDDEPCPFAPPEGYPHAVPDIACGYVFGRVIKELRQRNGQGDAGDGHGKRKKLREDVVKQNVIEVL